MWGVVLGYPVRTTGYFSAAQENMYAKTQVWFLHYNARPRSPGFAPATPGHQRQPKERGGVGQGRGGCGSWLTHPPCLCPPRGRAADAGLLLPNNRPAPDTRRRSPAAVLPSRPVISWFHGRGCEAGSGLGYLGREWRPRPRDVRGWPRRPPQKNRAAEARAPSSRGRTWLLSTVGATSCSQ